MKVQDLLYKDNDECIEWLIEHKDYIIIQKERLEELEEYEWMYKELQE